LLAEEDAEATRLNAGNWTLVQLLDRMRGMKNERLERALLDVLFSFMQADRGADLRLIARLLQATQREVVAAAYELAKDGLVVMATGTLTVRGMERAAEVRHGRAGARREVACAA
jgi:hypothetical protein